MSLALRPRQHTISRAAMPCETTTVSISCAAMTAMIWQEADRQKKEEEEEQRRADEQAERRKQQEEAADSPGGVLKIMSPFGYRLYYGI